MSSPIPDPPRAAATSALSRLALGGWVFGATDWGGQDDADSRATMEAALDLGITHWDTALAYGGGHAEILCGEVLRDKRDRVFLATKGMPGEHPDSMVRTLETSLRNLGTDHIDLYYFHWPRRGMDLRPHMERLEEARRRGLVRGIGVSNFSVEQMEQLREVGTIDAHQLCYSLLWRHGEDDLLPYCQRSGIAVTTYSSLAQGILAGRFGSHPSFREGDARRRTVFFDEAIWPTIHEAARALRGVAESYGSTMAALAIHWVMRRPEVTAVVLGARTPAQLAETVRALGAAPPPQALEELSLISEKVRPLLSHESNIFRYDP